MGDMGGMGRIWFSALDRYADRFGIEGDDFDQFLTFMHALDDEFIRHAGEKRKEELARRKREKG